MTKRALASTMLYMSAASLMSANASGSPQNIQGHELYTKIIKPDFYDPEDKKSVAAEEEAFNERFEKALDDGWCETIAEALEAETAEPDPVDADTEDAMKAAVAENDELKAQLEEGQKVLDEITKERDELVKGAKADAKTIKKLQADLDKIKAKADARKKLKSDLKNADLEEDA